LFVHAKGLFIAAMGRSQTVPKGGAIRQRSSMDRQCGIW
jgi:hypothetical protein